MRKQVMAGNWKMNMTSGEAGVFVRENARLFACPGREVILFVPFTCLGTVSEACSGTGVLTGAQNLYHEPSGAFTGEISVAMIAFEGATHVLVGHSERRRYFLETDDQARQKVAAAVSGGLVPILCVGESLEERRSGATRGVLASQVRALAGIEGAGCAIIAYEPVWAIGTGEAADPAQAAVTRRELRELLEETLGECAGDVRILYGGSVNAANAASFLEEGGFDGLLVGGASLSADFAAVTHACA